MSFAARHDVLDERIDRHALGRRRLHGRTFNTRHHLRVVKRNTVLVQRERLPFRRQRDRLVRRRKQRHRRVVRRADRLGQVVVERPADRCDLLRHNVGRRLCIRNKNLRTGINGRLGLDEQAIAHRHRIRRRKSHRIELVGSGLVERQC